MHACEMSMFDFMNMVQICFFNVGIVRCFENSLLRPYIVDYSGIDKGQSIPVGIESLVIDLADGVVPIS